MMFSIITVNYNSGSELLETVQSTLNQSYIGFELIIIDGLSTDNSVKDVRNVINDGRIFISSEKDNGIYDAMNKGIKIAKGIYTIFMNSGDKFESRDVLERIVDSGLNEDVLIGQVRRPRRRPAQWPERRLGLSEHHLRAARARAYRRRHRQDLR